MVELKGESQKIQKYIDDLFDVAGSHNLLQKDIGRDIARSVKKRLNQIRGCNSYDDIMSLPIGKPETLSGNLKGYCSLRLTGNYRLVFRPDCDIDKIEELKCCDRVFIKGVIDYHGKNRTWLIP